MQEILARGRARRAREGADGDVALYNVLMLELEQLAKIVTLELLALLDDARDGEEHRYRAEYDLIRTVGLGGWIWHLQQLVTGPAAGSFDTSASPLIRELSQKVKRTADAWQHEAVTLLSKSAAALGLRPLLGDRVSLMTWFELVRDLRNKARGHGAQTLDVLHSAVGDLQTSLDMVMSRLSLLSLPSISAWHAALGSLRALPLSESVNGVSGAALPGLSDSARVYLQAPSGRWRPVNLLATEVGCPDFWIPNGDYRDKGPDFEAISYTTGLTRRVSARAYLTPPVPLPPSETEGLSVLDAIGETLANIPPKKQEYIYRPDVEPELISRLQDPEEDPIVTLDGMGGIGKTSSALSVLHRLAQEATFDFILWFSARDVDLLSTGPAEVHPRVRSLEEMADQCVQLLRPYTSGFDQDPPLDAFRKLMRHELHSGRVLFVFDNFETVHNPGDVFRQLKASVRLPNKALITTRHEEFRGHFPIDVPSMPYELFKELVDTTASRIGIVSLLQGREDWIKTVHRESYGHPYIVRIVLGEARRAQKLGKFDRMLASQKDILPALFKRSFDGLSEDAKRTMLLLCSWRSLVPVVALEAVLTRPDNELISVEDALQELEELSLIDRVESVLPSVNVPQSAYQYVRSYEFNDSPYKVMVRDDARYLQLIGTRGPNHGSAQLSLVSFVAGAIDQRATLARRSVDHVLRHMAEKYAGGWLDAADYYEEVDDLKSARDALHNARRQEGSDISETNSRLLAVYRKLNDPREFDLGAELAETYRREARFYDLSRLTTEMVQSVMLGRGGEKREALNRILTAWSGVETQASSKDAEGLRVISERLFGKRSAEYDKWNQLAVFRGAPR